MNLRASGVIVRFIPLLDVAFILLGMMMVLMAQASMKPKQHKKEETVLSALQPISEQAGLDIIYLYAGTAGAEWGRCYELGPQQEILREIRTDVPDDMRRLLALRSKRATPLVVLLISDQGFDAVWSEKKLAAMKKQWNVEIARIYPFRRQVQPGGRS
ncbi:MAG TPA: hypothetical protein PKA06_02165 [Gemmatales bacterium]|nr:hypothetical protein [Gemmatales bacterium]HMP17591.1 hypothetical protein [Gemmatales bacterium]